MRQPDKVYLAILAFRTFVPSDPFFCLLMTRLVTYVFDSVIFGTFILHLNSCWKRGGSWAIKKLNDSVSEWASVWMCVTLRAPLSGTFLQSLPDLVTPLKGHFHLRAAVQRRGQRPPKGSSTNMTVEATTGGGKKRRKKEFRLDSNDCGFICAGVNFVGGYKWHTLFYLSCL